ncbi:adenylosuccinate synthase [Thermoplasma sp.]|uniref:adenylosuccinate synthase n=1 Tax=Thermoplasma sp. TaxID=1973142 RepID=UPI00126AA11D|nr:adenylosuccinate synthase [Thermoplasma sp.]KAA8922696.1 MAG: adenylosuccinate synthase [Thermoplasma sp.]
MVVPNGEGDRTAAVVGLQFGDEGKGKITDYLSGSYDVVVRFNGGTNAGHTVVTDEGTFKFHLLPSGSLRTSYVVLGSGMVIDPVSLIPEIEIVKKINPALKIMISRNAHVVTKMHRQIDVEEEKIRSSLMIGTTAQGIGPTYEDKYARTGIRMADISDLNVLREKIETMYRMHSNLLSGTEFSDPSKREDMAKEINGAAQKLNGYLDYTELAIEGLYSQGKRILFEGAQGVFLDPDFGFYPFVTSSNTISASIYTGTGFSLRKVNRIIGVAKAYVSKVGEGPFPTEVTGDLAKQLRDLGGEYGTTTGRPRRVGWLDLPMLKYAVRIDDVDEIAITKVDTLGMLDKVKVCRQYVLDGKPIDYIPRDMDTIKRVQPVYDEFDGWGQISDSISGRKISIEQLPPRLVRYIKYVEEQVGKPIGIISMGKERNRTVRIIK